MCEWMYWIRELKLSISSKDIPKNFLTKPDFVAYNHRHADVLSRKICRGLYGNMAAAWTIKSQQELDEAKKHFDVFIFDSFIPD